MSLPEYVTINGTRYATEKLPEAGRVQVSNIQAVDQEVARLQQQLAMMQTARNAYVAALVEAVKVEKNTEAAPAGDAVKPRTPRKKKATA